MNYLHPLKYWGLGFESHSRRDCLRLFYVCVVLCLAAGWSLIQGVLPNILDRETEGKRNAPCFRGSNNKYELLVVVVLLLLLLLLRSSLLETAGLECLLGMWGTLLCSVSIPQVKTVPMLDTLQLLNCFNIVL
jgi:hypothetical protein